jgi:hypothetical protein
MQNLQKVVALEEKETQTKEDENRKPQSTLSFALAIIKIPKTKAAGGNGVGTKELCQKNQHFCGQMRLLESVGLNCFEDNIMGSK